MDVKHYPPRKRTHVTRGKYQRDLGICFFLTILFLVVLVFVTLAFGQDHPFPFKTFDQLLSGTPGWPIGVPAQPQGICTGSSSKLVVTKTEYQSGAGSIWLVYTDGVLFAAAYFVPGTQIPVVVVEGHILDGKVVVEKYTAFTGDQRPCDRWNQRPA